MMTIRPSKLGTESGKMEQNLENSSQKWGMSHQNSAQNLEEKSEIPEENSKNVRKI
jgi:hypothetical protein